LKVGIEGRNPKFKSPDEKKMAMGFQYDCEVEDYSLLGCDDV
jgi:hypothetical protein